MQQTGETSSPLCDLRLTESAIRAHWILKELRDVGMTGKKVDYLCVSVRNFFPSFELPSPQVCR